MGYAQSMSKQKLTQRFDAARVDALRQRGLALQRELRIVEAEIDRETMRARAAVLVTATPEPPARQVQ